MTYAGVDESHRHPVPKLEPLSLSHIETTYSRKQLLYVLKERQVHGLGLKEFVIWSCSADGEEDESKFGE